MLRNPIELAIVVILLLLLFGGKGKLSSMMGDLAKGLRSFKEGITTPPDEAAAKSADAPPPRSLNEPIDVTPKKDPQKA